jgi:Ring finger domain
LTHIVNDKQSTTESDEYDSTLNNTTCHEADDDHHPSIRIPAPGVSLRLPPGAMKATRPVPGLCSICLIPYKVGSHVVWSSNPACEHVFHVACMETWLLQPSKGPCCPCCRQDFVLDALLLSSPSCDASVAPSEATSVRWTRQTATASELRE